MLINNSRRDGMNVSLPEEKTSYFILQHAKQGGEIAKEPIRQRRFEKVLESFWPKDECV